MSTDIAYVGFDCSSKAIHCVVLDGCYNIVVQKKWGSTEKTFDSRFPEFARNFYQDFSKIILTPTENMFVAIEQSIFIQNPKTTMEIANVIGCVRTACYLRGFDVVVVDNRRWKKVVLGNGNAKKPDIMKYAIDKWGEVFTEQDFADAACVASWRLEEKKNEEST